MLNGLATRSANHRSLRYQAGRCSRLLRNTATQILVDSEILRAWTNLLNGLKPFFCTLLMGCGLFVDLWLSPTHSIPQLCSIQSGPWASLVIHVSLMPIAHCGMVLGSLIAVMPMRGGERLGKILRFACLLFRMLVVEIATILLLASANPLTMMVGMGGLMAGLELTLGLARRTNALMGLPAPALAICTLPKSRRRSAQRGKFGGHWLDGSTDREPTLSKL